MNQKLLNNLVAPVAFFATFAANANAAGLIPGQCYAKADAEAVLKQEGQMPIIFGNRIRDVKLDRWLKSKHKFGDNYYTGQELESLLFTFKDEKFKEKFINDEVNSGNKSISEAKNLYAKTLRALELLNKYDADSGPEEKEYFANAFTFNDHGYGYNIEGDHPLGKKNIFVHETKEVCVAAAYKKANIYSLDRDVLPEWAKKIKVTGNGIDVQKAYLNGNRIILGAQSFTPKADGSEQLGKNIVVLAGVDKIAYVLTVDLEFRPNTFFDLSNFGVTNFMNQFLSRTVD